MGLGPVIYDYKMVFHDSGGHPVAFEITHEDNTDASPTYYGYVSSFGSWVIMQTIIIGSTRQYTYAAGKLRSAYDTHWDAGTGRFVLGDLTFTTFDQLGADL